MAKATTKNASGQISAEDGKADYEITALAPARIAGQRRAEEQTEIRLTEEEARAELLAGHIRPKGLPPRKDRKPTEPEIENPASNEE